MAFFFLSSSCWVECGCLLQTVCERIPSPIYLFLPYWKCVTGEENAFQSINIFTTISCTLSTAHWVQIWTQDGQNIDQAKNPGCYDGVLFLDISDRKWKKNESFQTSKIGGFFFERRLIAVTKREGGFLFQPWPGMPGMSVYPLRFFRDRTRPKSLVFTCGIHPMRDRGRLFSW